MVTSAARSTIAPDSNGISQIPHAPSKSEGAPSNRMTCPRCQARLEVRYHEPECIYCGYMDYTQSPVNVYGNSVMNSATEYIIRYGGESRRLANLVTHVKVRRVRNRVEYGVRCPFDGIAMVQTSLSGKRKAVREHRFRCAVGHRLSLAPRDDNSLSWK